MEPTKLDIIDLQDKYDELLYHYFDMMRAYNYIYSVYQKGDEIRGSDWEDKYLYENRDQARTAYMVVCDRTNNP